MFYTVSDFAHDNANNVRIIAGQGGLARAIEEVSILDYEFIPVLNDKFSHMNFGERQIVLSTFLYAKDDPAFLITEAIKKLAGTGASALVIKNVLHLPIPETAIRYADARNFPVFLVTSNDTFIDHITRDVYDRIREITSAIEAERRVARLVQGGLATEERIREARSLNPSFGNICTALYVMLPDGLTPSLLAELEARFLRSPLAGLGSVVTGYENGLLVLLSDADGADLDLRQAVEALRMDVIQSEAEVIGASERHYALAELGGAIREAVRAARLAGPLGKTTVFYDELGTLRVLLPYAAEPSMVRFAEQILEPLRSYDAERSVGLMETLATYVAAGQDVHAAAEQLDQHVNTVRYRLDRIGQLTGLSPKVPDQMEQLSLAVKIDLCRK